MSHVPDINLAAQNSLIADAIGIEPIYLTTLSPLEETQLLAGVFMQNQNPYVDRDAAKIALINFIDRSNQFILDSEAATEIRRALALTLFFFYFVGKKIYYYEGEELKTFTIEPDEAAFLALSELAIEKNLFNHSTLHIFATTWSQLIPLTENEASEACTEDVESPSHTNSL